MSAHQKLRAVTARLEQVKALLDKGQAARHAPKAAWAAVHNARLKEVSWDGYLKDAGQVLLQVKGPVLKSCAGMASRLVAEEHAAALPDLAQELDHARLALLAEAQALAFELIDEVRWCRSVTADQLTHNEEAA